MVDRVINGTLTGTRDFQDLYPFTSRFMPVQGYVMHYLDEGRGHPVIMIHGNPTWSFYYRNVIKGLCGDFRTIVPDHIGCGLSDKPDARTYDYTLASRVQDLDDLIRGLDIQGRVSLIVHDWGGMIGLAWAVRNPDRIARMVITNTSGFPLPRDKTFPFVLRLIKSLPFLAAPLVLGFNAFARGALWLACETKLPDKVRKGLVAPYNSWKNRIATLQFVRDIPIHPEDPAFALVAEVDRNLERFRDQDLMFLWGTRDFVFDRTFLNAFRRRFPRARTHTFHDAGHYLFEDRPDDTVRLIREFLLA